MDVTGKSDEPTDQESIEVESSSTFPRRVYRRTRGCRRNVDWDTVAGSGCRQCEEVGSGLWRTDWDTVAGSGSRQYEEAGLGLRRTT